MFQAEIEQSARYLASPDAALSLEADAYWPKWDSPWWHMLVLHEMGAGDRIPDSTVSAMIAALNRYPLKIFPIHHGDMPEGLDPFRHTACHCMVGCIYQILACRGVSVDEKVPWLRPWLLSYQMADGGMSCDNEAYLAKHECPSSMVGTIAPFEAILRHTPRPSAQELAFLDRAAVFLIERRLTCGSSTKHNASEREEAKAWTKLAFPRFYFYDVLRGLTALLEYSERFEKPVPWSALEGAVNGLEPVVGRQAFTVHSTLLQKADGTWHGRVPATLFPLLKAVSANGPSPYLEREWATTSARLARLREKGLVR